ncbi:hypothetical protein [Hymenobacter baengnokdamensis]|uniref:hypothetical protein n=1 Tax=Hymenobacter baengnokdamensis TaxID=2615203 RepID=UPI0012442357|nr:hypothetical protein [Hymenobacter baengnokdamensis]
MQEINEVGNVHDRIAQMVDRFCKGNKTAFGRGADIQSGVLAGIIGGRKNKPSFEVLQKIFTGYPTVNPDWLLFGRGEMLRPETGLDPFESASKVDEEKKRQFLPPMDDYYRRREEEWTKYHKEVEQREKDRAALRALVEHLAKNDSSGELAKIQQLLPSALKRDIDPDEMDNLSEAQHEELEAEARAAEQAEWARQRQEREQEGQQ